MSASWLEYGKYIQFAWPVSSLLETLEVATALIGQAH